MADSKTFTQDEVNAIIAQLSNTSDPIQDMVRTSIEAKKLEAKQANWKQSEIKKLTLAMTKEIDIINASAKDVLCLIEDEFQAKSLRLKYDQEIINIRATYQPQIDAVKIDVVQASEGVSNVIGNGAGKVVELPVKSAISALKAFGQSSGLSSLFNK